MAAWQCMQPYAQQKILLLALEAFCSCGRLAMQPYAQQNNGVVLPFMCKAADAQYAFRVRCFPFALF